MLTDKDTSLNDALPEDMITGYQYEGKEIIAVRRPGYTRRRELNPKWFSQVQKTDAATLYAVYGDVDEVSKLTDVPTKVIREWKDEPWFVEIQKRVYTEQNDKLSSRISGVLNKTIEHLVDRLDNGDSTYNPKTGAIERKPIEARVLASLFESLSHQRHVTRGEPTSIQAKVGMDDRLAKLEQSFLRFSAAKEIEGDATVIEDATD